MPAKRRAASHDSTPPQVRTLRRALDADGYTWAVSSQWGANATELGVVCEHATYEIVLRDDGSIMTSYCELPTRVPEQRRPAMAEAIVRANWEFRDRSFDLSYDDGSVTLRSSIYHGGARLTPAMATHLAVDCAEVAEKFYPAFVKVCFADADPQAEIMEAIYPSDD